MEEYELMKQAKYRGYMSNIDKALKNFEYSSEWADLISALGKLNKVISSYPQYQIIPRRIKISKRLAQCMHPALPSGVHLKALETYDIIFSNTGVERLASELFIYSAGLFPLLGYAAMNVRPTLLGIYEKYFVPLGERLRPALSGFLSGVLPGYESGLDHFERTNTLLGQVCQAVNPIYFYTCLWECVATNASIRLPAVSYLIDHFNKRSGMDDQKYVIGKNKEVMMSGLCACLNDSLILVQRNTLEFLLLGFPMHTDLINNSDLTKLVTNGLNTILRRDMSLNRRLYAWLLGTEVSNKQHNDAGSSSTSKNPDSDSYFNKYSKIVLIKALRHTLKTSLMASPVDLSPYRILVSLLDKVEIGPVVLDDVLCDVIRTMSLSSGNIEVGKSANLLFATFDPAYIWNFMTQLYEKSCKSTCDTLNTLKPTANSQSTKFLPEVDSGIPSLIEVCYLTEFLLETISLEMYNETTRVYLPKVFLSITQMLTVYLETLKNDEIAASLKLCMKIVERVQPMVSYNSMNIIDKSGLGNNSNINKTNRDSTKSTNSIIAPNLENSLEKSKSDSKLNQTILLENENDEPIKRSNSNQSMTKESKNKNKKANNKKSKSYSRLLELNKDQITNDTGQLMFNSDSAISTPNLELNVNTHNNNNSSSSSNNINNNNNKKPNKSANIKQKSPKSSKGNKINRLDENIFDELNCDQLDNDGSVSLDTESGNTSTPESSLIMRHDGMHQHHNHHPFNDCSTSLQEYSILEKCIKQYEIFYQVFISQKILNINSSNGSSTTNSSATKLLPTINLIIENYDQQRNMTESIIQDTNQTRLNEINRLFDTLKIKLNCHQKKLYSLLNQTINSFSDETDNSSDSTECNDDEECDINVNQQVSRLLDLKLGDQLRDAVKLASNLLVDMSTFPSYNQNLVIDYSECEIPCWLKVLSIVACYVKTDKELQISTISTLFELVSILKSQMEHSTNPGVTFVVMLPLLKFGYVNFIETKTRIFQVLTSTLWDYLGDKSTDLPQISSLLYQLNNCLDSGLVETIIGHRIACSHVEWDSINANIQSSVQDDQFNYVNLEDSIMGNYQNRLTDYTRDRLYDVKIMCLPDATQLRAIKNDFINENQFIGFKKFELLWHLGRDLGQNTKSFDKTLLKMFDKLSFPYYSSIRIFVTKWLQESLIRGDLSRVIRPLLKIMLAPNTKKISILHAQTLRKADQQSNNEPTDKVDNENNDDETVLGKDIYAVRNDDGNVSYLIETPPSKKRSSPIRSLQKKFFGVTIGGSKAKSTNFMNTDKTSTTSFSSIETQIGNTNNISLIINPLDNSSDLEQPIDPIQDSQYSDSIEDQPKGISFKEDFYSSADDDVSLTSSNDTDSIRSDPYLSSTSTIDDNNLKRYVGNFNEVSEILSEHDRTKNKKTYHLNHKLNQSENDVSIAGNNVNNSFDESIPADEFFNNSSSSATELVIENVVNDLIMEAVEKIDSDDQMQHQHVQQAKRFSKQKPINKSVKIRNKTKTKSDKKSRHSTGNIADTRGAVLCNSPESSKRLSYTSKISTISSSSNNSSNLSDSKDSDNEVKDSDNDNSNIDVSKIVNNLENSEKLVESSVAATAIPNPSTEENIKKVIADAKKINWEKAKEVFDKVKRNVDILRKNSERELTDDKLRNEKVHQFHSHMLLYLGVYDTNQVLYAFQTLRNIISCNCRTFLCLSVTTAVSNSQIKQLLIRHKKSISGKEFTGTIINTEFSHAYRGCMYLEALVTICLYYARGYFQKESLTNDVYDVPTTDDIHGNHKIQMASIELLTLLCTELITIIKDKKLACYIADLMVKCKLQKIILHCVLLSVHSLNKSNGTTYSEQILRFNDPGNERLYSESLQIQLLRLLLSVIKLEYEVNVQKTDDAQQKSFTAVETNPSSHSPTRPTPSTPNNVKYLPNCLISQQPMFLSAILQALQSDTLKHLHRNWTDLVTSSLNCLNFGSLTNIVISVVHQICTNIDKIVKGGKSAIHPPDYTVSQLEALTVLCHFCLLDNTQQTSLTQIFNQSYPQMHSSTSNSNSSQLFNSLVNGILSTNSNENQTRNAQHMAARNAVLSHLPRIVASVAALWENEIGQQQNVKHQLLEFLSPISLHHGVNFLTAVAVAWQERGEAKRNSSTASNNSVAANSGNGRKNSIPANLTQSHKALPQATPEQMILVRLVSGIRVMPMDSFVQTLHQVVKSPPPIHHPPPGLILEVSALELFYFYMKGAPAPQLSDSWSSLLALLRDGLNLSPPAQFVMLTILNEFVQRCPQMPFQDKKDLRDLHDTTSRLVEALSTIAGACLEQTTWLRRNLAVKEDLNVPLHGEGNLREGGTATIIGNHQYSVQAQSVLAVVLANLLDVAYGSQEKDKVITIVTTLMYNIIPYLKNHTARNIPSFYACSHLLASLSGYQYTRKAWRKDLLDLLLDSTFFQMDLTCLPFWKSILDSLMTYDNTTFRELMNRVSLAQTGGLNIFTSKEQEYEQRALLLKRLAFVIFCSELDQYHKYMPEIQEQLANSLRLPQVVPSVQAAVFLCFRVLLLRMTPDNVTSLWPIIIAEMVQVFLAIEQELMTDTDEYSQHIKMLSGLDTSWVTNTSNGLHSQGHPHWRMVQLETAKLLEMGCVLPATILPHFQMYRWAFVGGKYDNDCHTNTLPKGNNHVHQTVFVPHVTRISRLMDCRYKDSSPQKQSIQDSKSKGGYLVLKCQNITNLLDLYPFFSIVGHSWAINSGTIEKDLKNCLEEIETVLSCDFLEKMPSNLNSR